MTTRRGVRRALGTTALAILASALPLAPACKCEAERQRERELGRVAHAIERLRNAPEHGKERELRALRQERCDDPEVCGLKGRCVSAYEELVAVFETASALKNRLKSGDVLTPKEREASVLALAEAEKRLTRAHESTRACADEQARLARE